MRVMVLGAYGTAGRAVLSAIVGLDDVEVVAAGRQQDRLAAIAERFPGVAVAAVDVRVVDGLRQSLQRVDVVVNCIGPYIGYGAPVVQAAIEAGAFYIDLASEQEHYRCVSRMNKAATAAGVSVIVGAGAYPGISGLLLRSIINRCPSARVAELALVTGHPAAGETGPAQVESGLLELSYVHQILSAGQLVVVRPGRSKTFAFQEPFRRQAMMEWPQLEVLWAAKNTEIRELSTWVRLGGQAPTPAWLLRAAARLGLHRPNRVSAWLKRLVLRRRQGPKTEAERSLVGMGALYTHVEGSTAQATKILTIKDVGWATAWLPAQLIALLRDGRLAAVGVCTPADLVDVDELLVRFQSAPGVFVTDVDSATAPA